MPITLNQLRQYIVLVNQGSGCIVQPENDEEHSYILTAHHVVKEAEENVEIVRFQLDKNDNWVDVKVPVENLVQGENYFPHPKVDIAIIRVQKIDQLDSIYGIVDLDKETDDFNFTGYPLARRDGDKGKWYRNDEKTTIKETKGHGLREAKVPGPLTIGETVGMSGGALVKIRADQLLLAGIQVKMVDGDEQLSRVEFTPFHYFQEIVSFNKKTLSPIATEKGGAFKRQDKINGKQYNKREFLNINISELSEDEDLKSELMALMRENSERVIFDFQRQEALIAECNEELFRNFEIYPIDKSTRAKFRESIGTALFRILRNFEPGVFEKIVKSNDPSDLGLQLSFETDEEEQHEDPEMSYSAIPWEYLYYPGKLRKNDFKYPLANKMVIVRGISGDDTKLNNRDAQLISELKVQFITKEDFTLFDESTEDPEDRAPIISVLKELKYQIDEMAQESPNFLKMGLTFKNLNKGESAGFHSKDLARLITNAKPSPNILHVITDLEKPDDEISFQLIEAINKASSQSDENRLALVVLQQSPREHHKGQYQNFDRIATDLLRKTRYLPAVMTIPFNLGEKSDVFSIPTFYKNLARGEKLIESYYLLARETLDNECIALPLLYMKYSDFAFVPFKEQQDERHWQAAMGSRTESAQMGKKSHRSADTTDW